MQGKIISDKHLGRGRKPSPTPDVSVLTFAYLVQPVSDRLEKKCLERPVIIEHFVLHGAEVPLHSALCFCLARVPAALL